MYYSYYSYRRKSTGREFFVPARSLIAVKLLNQPQTTLPDSCTPNSTNSPTANTIDNPTSTLGKYPNHFSQWNTTTSSLLHLELGWQKIILTKPRVGKKYTTKKYHKYYFVIMTDAKGQAGEKLHHNKFRNFTGDFLQFFFPFMQNCVANF